MSNSIESRRLYQLLGERIASERDAQELSQTQLADALQMSRGSIANIELGRQRPPLATIWSIADALDLDVRLLIPSKADLEAAADQEAAAGDAPDLPKHVEAFLKKGTSEKSRRALRDLAIKAEEGEE